MSWDFILFVSLIRPSHNTTFNCHNPKWIKFRSRKMLGLTHLREHNFKHSFQDFLNTFCSSGKRDVETSSHYLLGCSNYSEERLALLHTIKIIDISILQKSRNLLAFYFLVTLLLTISNILLLSLMPL